MPDHTQDFSNLSGDFRNPEPTNLENNERKKNMKTITKFIYAAFAAVVLAISAVTANGALGDLFVSINATGANDDGLIYEYTPTGVQCFQPIRASGSGL
jgi:hypothetical protein